jgi:hypothetical protein
LRSTVGPQAATIDFARGNVHISQGVARDAGVVIRADLETMGRPGAPKPKVTGALRHPIFAFGVAKVLDAGTPGGWQTAVDDLWSWAAGRDGRPDLLRVVCSDDGVEHTLGAPGGTRVEVHGPAWALKGVFNGDDHLGAAMLEGRVRAVAEFAALTRFVGLLTHFMLGDEGAR